MSSSYSNFGNIIMKNSKDINIDLEQNFKFASALIKIITVLIAILVLVVSRYAFIFFCSAMLPTIVAIFFDRNSHKCASATICTFNLIGALPYLMQLWQSNSINTVAKLVIADIDTWLVIYGAAFVGQLLYMSAPLLSVKIYSARIQVHVNKLKNKRQQLADEWSIQLEDSPKSSNEHSSIN